MARPVISVVVPTFNNAALLGETLDGITRQTVNAIEVIVIDDGSTDNTAQVVGTYAPEVTYIHQPNRGPAAARNRGAQMARGDYIAFCDHDDIWETCHLEMLLGCFTAYPDTALAFDNAVLFGEPGVGCRLHLTPARARAFGGVTVKPKTLLWQYSIATMSVVMVKKAAFDGIGGLNERIIALDDLHFYLRLATRAEVRYVDHVGCKKRVTANSLSHRIDMRQVNVQYLEDLWQNHPDVIRAIGPLSFRLRLARKYFKLARHYRHDGAAELAQRMFWKAYATNFLNLRYMWHALVH